MSERVRSGHLWAIGYDDMERAHQVTSRITSRTADWSKRGTPNRRHANHYFTRRFLGAPRDRGSAYQSGRVVAIDARGKNRSRTGPGER